MLEFLHKHSLDLKTWQICKYGSKLKVKPGEEKLVSRSCFACRRFQQFKKGLNVAVAEKNVSA